MATSTLSDFLQKHFVTKENRLTKPITHTRIGDKSSNISGGSYHIPDDDMETFMNVYYKNVFENGHDEYLTEKQLDIGAIVVDVDFRYPLTVNKRQHTRSHITDLIAVYLEKLKTMFVMDENTKIPVYVFEKPNVNCVPAKDLTKDGIHIIFGLKTDRISQILLRKAMLTELPKMWDDLPISNTWSEILDDGISIGCVNWQLFGSKKPQNERYELVMMETHTYDVSDGDFLCTSIDIDTENLRLLFPQLSVRYTGHVQLEFTSAFKRIHDNESSLRNTGSGGAGSAASAGGGGGGAAPHSNARSMGAAAAGAFNLDLNALKTMNDLEEMVGLFLDTLTTQEYELREIHQYTMILPSNYYDSYNEWIRVGWALRKLDNRLFLTWVLFSSQSKKFNFSGIRDMYEQWMNMDMKHPNGLTTRSIVHWAKTDAAERFKEVRQETVQYFIEQTLTNAAARQTEDSKVQGNTDFDLAFVLYQLFKDEYICANIRSNLWYRFHKHRWEQSDSGTTLRKAISTIMRDLYFKQIETLYATLASLDGGGGGAGGGGGGGSDEDKEKNKKIQQRINKIAEIAARLGKTKDKDNIMKESKELFYDRDFLAKLDMNPYLLCFNNGVIDFKEKQLVFRRGYPEDFVSKTTRIDYIPINKKDLEHCRILGEIKLFMHQLFPVAELEDYMWQHLASVLIGTSANQTFNMYVGIGQNGKSVLVNLMETILGEYKGDVPLTLITQQRTKVGGLAPELVALKGVRYAVMQEPSKGDKINEGIMKQITSGIDPIQCRAPYMTEVLNYIPQFKLVVCTNELMEIKSNDHGTWRRIRVVEFLSLFTEKPIQGDDDKPYQYLIDKHIIEKFVVWKELFMSLLVTKAFECRGIVTDCDIVMSSSKSYRQSQDHLAEFADERIGYLEGGKVGKREINEEFRIWYTSCYGRNIPNMRDLHIYIDKHYLKFDNVRSGWFGITIRYESANDDGNIGMEVGNDEFGSGGVGGCGGGGSGHRKQADNGDGDGDDIGDDNGDGCTTVDDYDL